MRRITRALCYSLIAVSFLGCASARKATLNSGNSPEKAIAEVTQVKEAALRDQIDILADEQFEKGDIYLNDANNALTQGAQSQEVLENAAIAKAYFEDARVTAKPRKSYGKRILEARKAALDAGLRKSEPLVEELKKVDDGLKSDTSQFTATLDPDDFSEYQNKYLALETKAVQFRELNIAKMAIEKATFDDAEDLAPKSLRTASLDFKTAENIIKQSPRSPQIYGQSVKESLASATMLRDVMEVILGAKGTPENIAIQIVSQKRALGQLSASLESTKQSLQEKEGALKKTEGVLKSQQEQLERASMQVRFQKAMDEARRTLPQQDALVYQQGNTLVFRLKRINFRSGTSIIPESSKPLLSKVNSIIKRLDADKVVVQGHTDSVGSENVNLNLSTNRAIAVASYLSSLQGGYNLTHKGYGESNPIASNETQAGRATNRRVDLVVSVKQ